MSLKQTTLNLPKTHHSDSESTQGNLAAHLTLSKPFSRAKRVGYTGRGSAVQNYQWSD